MWSLFNEDQRAFQAHYSAFTISPKRVNFAFLAFTNKGNKAALVENITVSGSRCSFHPGDASDGLFQRKSRISAHYVRRLIVFQEASVRPVRIEE
jgi:hypothetical protein